MCPVQHILRIWLKTLYWCLNLCPWMSLNVPECPWMSCSVPGLWPTSRNLMCTGCCRGTRTTPRSLGSPDHLKPCRSSLTAMVRRGISFKHQQHFFFIWKLYCHSLWRAIGFLNVFYSIYCLLFTSLLYKIRTRISFIHQLGAHRQRLWLQLHFALNRHVYIEIYTKGKIRNHFWFEDNHV